MEWEIESVITGKEFPALDDKLEVEIFLTKFKALTAKKILLVAKEKNIDAAEILAGVEEWVKKFYAEKS